MNNILNSFVSFYIENGYIEAQDAIYCKNIICGIIKVDNKGFILTEGELYDNLNKIVEIGIKNMQIENTSYNREILEAMITNVFVEKPSNINNYFHSLENKEARDWFLKLGVDTNYIKKHDLERNISFSTVGSKSELEITINLSKPEKDPAEIAKLKTIKASSYPNCPLCIENVGYLGSPNQAARTNHRVIDMKLNNREFFFQFSPYMYYDEHCIVIEKNHNDMTTNDETIKDQLDFVDQFEGYFIGTNADIPIVGGSILDHNHYQGGNKEFPIDGAKVSSVLLEGEVKISYIDWYLTSLVLESTNRDLVIEYTNKLREAWLKYDNEAINIFNSVENRHNAINTITRKIGDTYKVIIMLRNNKTTNEHPSGIYHPDVHLHHIKKENIGLIEAMGLAILPGRLEAEIKTIFDYVNGKDVEVEMHHLDWANELKDNYNGEEISSYVHNSIGDKFEEVLSACNVLKYCENDVKIIKEIIEGVK